MTAKINIRMPKIVISMESNVNSHSLHSKTTLKFSVLLKEA